LEKGSFGIELMRQNSERMGPSTVRVLLAAPKVIAYSPEIGFTQHAAPGHSALWSHWGD
jgi:hypothetical protein